MIDEVRGGLIGFKLLTHQWRAIGAANPFDAFRSGKELRRWPTAGYFGQLFFWMGGASASSYGSRPSFVSSKVSMRDSFKACRQIGEPGIGVRSISPRRYRWAGFGQKRRRWRPFCKRADSVLRHELAALACHSSRRFQAELFLNGPCQICNLGTENRQQIIHGDDSEKVSMFIDYRETANAPVTQ